MAVEGKQMAGPPPPYSPPPPANPPPGYGPQQPAPYGYGGPSGYGFPPAYGYPAAPRKRRRISALGCFLLLLLLLAIAVIGLAIALLTGIIKTGTLLNLIGMGPANVEVTNMRDDTISVVLQKANADGTTETANSDLGSFDVRNLTAPDPGRFQLTITDASGSQVAACSINVTGGSKWQFVVLADVTLVTRNSEKPASPDDLFVTSSSLCR